MTHPALVSRFALAALLCLASGWFIAQEAGPQVRTDSASGLQTATFQTPQGRIVVNLPDDLMAGDTISGTVIAEPNPVRDKNDPKAQQQYTQDEGELNGLVVEIQSQKASPKDEQTQLTVPPDAKSIPVILKNKNGAEIAKTEIPLAPPANEKAPGKLDKQRGPTIPNLESFGCQNNLRPSAFGHAGTHPD